MKPDRTSIREILSPPLLTYPCHQVRALGRARSHWKPSSSSRPLVLTEGPLGRDPQLAQLEAYLFAADEPLAPRKLASLLKLKSSEEIRRLIGRLGSLYDQEASALQIVEIAGGYQLRTREEFLPWLLKLRNSPSLYLSPAARETLTMIAYRQPINRADLEGMRGVSCTDILRVLLEKGLICIVGRDKTLGRPVQYGTTKLFLQMTGLKSIEELPALRD